jgi:hypothetical protein
MKDFPLSQGLQTTNEPQIVLHVLKNIHGQNDVKRVVLTTGRAVVVVQAVRLTSLRHGEGLGRDLITNAVRLGHQLAMQALQDPPRSTTHLG